MSVSSTEVNFEAAVQSINDVQLVLLPRSASKALPSRGQVAAIAIVNNHSFDTVIEPDGLRGHWIKLEAVLLKSLAVSNGDKLTFSLKIVEQWPEPFVPEDLAMALEGAADLADLWQSITPMARSEWVRWIGSTNNPTTRAKRVDVSLSKMRSGKRRPCCFDRSSCTDPAVAKSGKLNIAKLSG